MQRDEVRKKSPYAQHTTAGSAYLLIGYAIIIAVGAVVVPFFALWAAWFGAIYLVPALVSVFALGLVATRQGHVNSWKKSMLWFLIEGATGVAVATLFSATIVPLYSGTQISQLIVIQFSLSIIFFVASILVAIVWRTTKKARRRRQS